MNLLYPQYVKYYSFLDTELSKIELNASRIVTYLKSFVSAGIANKTIILFDNDAEGVFQQQELLASIKEIPENFRIMRYPNIEIAKDYPTLCPTGIEHLDINGSACSIELYLCEEVLTQEGVICPIELKMYHEKVERYHGSFSNKDKDAIQKDYRKIINKCIRDLNEISNHNFENMKDLLKSIIIAFD